MDSKIIRTAVRNLFTMTIAFDRNLIILETSERLQKHCPSAANGRSLDQFFDFHRPTGISSFEDVLANVNSLFLLTSKDGKLALRGQIVQPQAENSDWLIFMGSPWLSWMSENCPQVKLELADFPRHDSQMDHSFYIATQHAMVDDLEKLNLELKSAKNQAEQANRTQSDFFAVMSHEMRTPLNGVISALSLIHDTSDEKIRADLLSVAQTSADGLLSVVNYVLDYSKLQAGKLTIEAEPFELKETIYSVRDILQTKAQAKNLDFQVFIASDCPAWLVGDDLKIRQILINLASNAVKFTQNGSVVLRVNAETTHATNVTLRFEVEDTGTGIPEELKDRIFDPFWSSQDRTPHGEANTGLGLNICKRLVDLMDGNISYTSVVGQGSCFTVSINIQQAAESDVRPPQIESFEQANFQGEVLLVDDNQTNLLLGKMMLENMGIDVRTASDGIEAVEIASAINFDLILMDITMPELDGISATEQLRALGSEVPIVALTAHVGEGQTKDYLARGMQGVVHKPIIRGELVKTLARWLTAIQPKSEPAVRLSASNEETLDTEVLQTLINSVGKDNFKLAYRLFVTETRDRMKRLLSAWIQRDLKILLHESHTIGSSAGSFGAIALHKHMRAIEHASDTEDLSALIKLLPHTEKLHQDAMHAFDRFVGKAGA